jgi:hypothetical protein
MKKDHVVQSRRDFIRRIIDRTSGSNYHTKYDTLDRMDPEAMRLMNKVCSRVVARIDADAGGMS